MYALLLNTEAKKIRMSENIRTFAIGKGNYE